MYLVRATCEYQYVIVHRTKNRAICSIKGHSTGCQHLQHTPISCDALGELLVDVDAKEGDETDFFLANYHGNEYEEILKPPEEDNNNISAEERVCFFICLYFFFKKKNVKFVS